MLSPTEWYSDIFWFQKSRSPEVLIQSGHQTWLLGKWTIEIGDVPIFLLKPPFSSGIFQPAMFDCGSPADISVDHGQWGAALHAGSAFGRGFWWFLSTRRRLDTTEALARGWHWRVLRMRARTYSYLSDFVSMFFQAFLCRTKRWPLLIIAIAGIFHCEPPSLAGVSPYDSWKAPLWSGHCNQCRDPSGPVRGSWGKRVTWNRA